MRRLDLHTHSRYSDGTSSPAEVVGRARAAGVEIMVLTDHDSVSGFPEARDAASAAGLRVLCGVEINTCEHDNLHVLGYRIDPQSSVLTGRLQEFRERRRRRLLKIIDQLRQVGLDLNFEDVRGVSLQALGRPHVADAMIRKGMVGSRKEAFERYLVKGKPGYVSPMGPTPEEAIAVIQEAGGWASLAHPGALEDEECLKRLVACGLAGIEVFYPTHSFQTIQNLLVLAAQHGLRPTAGSDYHGPGTGRDRIGGIKLEDDMFRRLEEWL